jgi:hypothetical protein
VTHPADGVALALRHLIRRKRFARRQGDHFPFMVLELCEFPAGHGTRRRGNRVETLREQFVRE